MAPVCGPKMSSAGGRSELAVPPSPTHRTRHHPIRLDLAERPIRRRNLPLELLLQPHDLVPQSSVGPRPNDRAASTAPAIARGPWR